MAASSVSLPGSSLNGRAAYTPGAIHWSQHQDEEDDLQSLLRGQGSGISSSVANQRSMQYQRPVYEAQQTSAPEVVSEILAKRQEQSDSIFTSDSSTSYPSETRQLPTGMTEISGQPSATAEAGSRDHLLAIMPAFAFSMPTQILVTGINIALISVIAVHLLFTIQYHVPLSRDNWIFQICSTLMLLISLIVYISVVFGELQEQSHNWPYTFDYLAAPLPPTDGSWSTVRCAFFLLMRAITTLLIHLTHIQFLTLLYPSALEARLILWMLGPLALIAAGMEFTELSSEDDVKTSDLGDAIRNICNSTLTLLYSCALLIWGGLVNRRRAWRSDGGTASFGGGAMGLAAMNTVMSFVQIRYDRLWWLPDICWTLTLWQSWLGFWWWVGAGMGIGEVEDREERAEKRRKRLAKEKRKAEKRAEGGEEGGSEILTGFKRFKDRITGDTSQKANSASSTGGTLSRRRPRKTDSTEAQASPSEGIELQEVATSTSPRDSDGNVREGAVSHELTNVSVVRPEGDDQGIAPDEDSPASAAGSSATTSGRSSSRGLAQRASFWFDAYTPQFIKQRMRRLRIAHAAAAAKAADEQTILRNQVLGGSRQPGLRAMMLERDDDIAGSRRSSRANAANEGSRRQSAATVGGTRRDRSATVEGRSSAASRRLPATTERDDGSSSFPRTEGIIGPNNAGSLPAPPPGPITPISATTTAYSLASSEGRLEVDRSSLLAQDGRQGNEDDDDEEWIEEVGPLNASPAIGTSTSTPTTTSHNNNNNSGDRVQPSNEDESSSSSGSGSATEIAPGQQTTSWTWRGGLTRARLRDRRTYD